MSNPEVKVVPVNPISQIPIFTNDKGVCAYSSFEYAGAPKFKKLHLLPGQGLDGKIYTWLAKNWMSEPYVTRGLVSILADIKDGSLKSIPVRSLTAVKVFKGIMKFIADYEHALSHLIPIHFPDLSLGGTPMPKPSKAFNNMSFAERQAILTANNDAKLELIIDDKEETKNG